MAKVLVTDSNLTNIANAIRTKNGSTDTYTPGAMPSAILAIVGSSISLQTKTVTPNTATQTVTADSGYNGLSKVVVNPIPNTYTIPAGTITITVNGTTDVANYAYANVNIQNAAPSLQTKTVTPTTATQTITADANYDGLSSVVVNPMPTGALAAPCVTVNNTGEIAVLSTVGTAGYLSTATYTIGGYQLPTIAGTTFTPNNTTQTYGSAGLFMLDTVTIKPIPSGYTIPAGTVTITANGTSDVKNYASVNVQVSPSLQSKTVYSSASTQTITADSGYYGLKTVTINGMSSGVLATPQIQIDDNGIIGAFSSIETEGFFSTETYTIGTYQMTTLATTTITPTTATQTVGASGTYMLGSVKVNPIPSNYTIPSGTINITTNNTTVNVANYASASISISFPPTTDLAVTATLEEQYFEPPSGYSGFDPVIVYPMATATFGTTVNISGSGLITYAVFANSGGTVEEDQAIDGSYQMTTISGQTVTPTTSNQTLARYSYLTGTVTIKGDTNLVGGNIKSGVSIFGVTGTLSFATYYTGTATPASSLGTNGDLYLQI